MRVTLTERARAWLLLCSFVTSFASAVVNIDHFGQYDVACGDVALVDGTETRVWAPLDGDGAEHCQVCHFLRTVRGGTTSLVAELAALQDACVPAPIRVHHALAAATAVGSGRAPPTHHASLLS